MSKKNQPVRLDQIVLERTAHILGEYSAAAKALRHAETLGCRVEFWRVGTKIIVRPIEDQR